MINWIYAIIHSLYHSAQILTDTANVTRLYITRNEFYDNHFVVCSRVRNLQIMKLTIILSIFGCQWLIAICLTRATALVHSNSDVPVDKVVSQIDTGTGDDKQQREIMTILDNSTKTTAEWNINSNVAVKSTGTSISGYEATVSDPKLKTTDYPIVRMHDFSEENTNREDISKSAKMQITNEVSSTTNTAMTQTVRISTKLPTSQTSQKFTIDTTRTATIVDPCLNSGTCSLLSTMKHRFCQCDNACKQSNGCCVDSDIKTEVNIPLIEYMGCQRISTNAYEGVFIVDKCPVSFQNNDIVQNCQNDQNISESGILVMSHSGVVFKNKYCSLCHGVLDFSTFRIQFLSLLFKEQEFDKYSTMSTQERIDYFLQTDETYRMVAPRVWIPRPCTRQLTVNNFTLCGKYVNPVRVLHTPRGMLHRNYFCVPVYQLQHIRCTGVNFDKLFQVTDFNSLQIMFAFDDEDQVHQEQNVTVYFFLQLFCQTQRSSYQEGVGVLLTGFLPQGNKHIYI